jgi:hypothetical protein
MGTVSRLAGADVGGAANYYGPGFVIHCPLVGVIPPGHVAGVVVITSQFPVAILRVPERHAGPLGVVSDIQRTPAPEGCVPGGHIGFIVPHMGPKRLPGMKKVPAEHAG